MRNDEFFLRDSLLESDVFDIPMIKKDDVDLENLKLIAVSDTRIKERKCNLDKAVHFFVDDYRFEKYFKNPSKYIEQLRQYPFVLSPDFSLYGEMPRWLQLNNVAKNRWCGSYWQSEGIKVIPTISWSLPDSYEFCFKGVEKGSIVAVSTIGCAKYKAIFMAGYNEMLKRLEPEAVICFGKPFKEMSGNIVEVDYIESRQGNHKS